jgi:ABC-type enterochelin transport system permease subunit
MAPRGVRAHDRRMFESILLSIAILIGPAAIVLGSLALLGIAVAALADAAPNGLIRPTVS